MTRNIFIGASKKELARRRAENRSATAATLISPGVYAREVDAGAIMPPLNYSSTAMMDLLREINAGITRILLQEYDAYVLGNMPPLKPTKE